MTVGLLALSSACSDAGDAVSTVSTTAESGATAPAASVAGSESPVSAPSASVPPTTGRSTTATSDTRSFETLPPVNSYLYPSEPDAVVAQISSRVPVGPPTPLLTIYGDGRVVAGTTAGWFEGRIADGDIQLFLDEAESVGLLDDPLTLRGPDSDAEPDLTALFDVDGERRFHEFDLSRIERPVALRAFLQDASVYNRFALSDPFDPGAWLSCDTDAGGVDGCEVLEAPSSPADRPVLPHEIVDDLLSPP